MSKLRFVGLDVHKDTIVMPVAEEGQSEAVVLGTFPHDVAKLLKRQAQFLRSGDLTAVWVPDEQTEALRVLERSRDDAKNAERVARHQLEKFLLRNAASVSRQTILDDASLVIAEAAEMPPPNE